MPRRDAASSTKVSENVYGYCETKGEIHLPLERDNALARIENEPAGNGGRDRKKRGEKHHLRKKALNQDLRRQIWGFRNHEKVWDVRDTYTLSPQKL